MTTESKTTITSLLNGLQLFKLIAADFQPRTLKEIIELARLNGHDWSQTKIFDMLNTLAAEQFVRKSSSGEWAVAPQITAISATFHNHLIRRSTAILEEVAEIKSASERML